MRCHTHYRFRYAVPHRLPVWPRGDWYGWGKRGLRGEGASRWTEMGGGAEGDGPNGEGRTRWANGGPNAAGRGRARGGRVAEGGDPASDGPGPVREPRGRRYSARRDTAAGLGSPGGHLTRGEEPPTVLLNKRGAGWRRGLGAGRQPVTGLLTTCCRSRSRTPPAGRPRRSPGRTRRTRARRRSRAGRPTCGRRRSARPGCSCTPACRCRPG